MVGTLVLVQVARLPRGERRREPRALWLLRVQTRRDASELELLWRAYVRRFDLETRSAFSSRRLDGRARGCAYLSRPTGRRG